MPLRFLSLHLAGDRARFPLDHKMAYSRARKVLSFPRNVEAKHSREFSGATSMFPSTLPLIDSLKFHRSFTFIQLNAVLLFQCRHSLEHSAALSLFFPFVTLAFLAGCTFTASPSSRRSSLTRHVNFIQMARQ